MKAKYIISICFGVLWLTISFILAISWAKEVSYIFPAIYVWLVICGIALLPGFLMSTLFFSNLLNWKLQNYPTTAINTTIILCAHNEGKTISKSIQKILEQEYAGHIHLLVVDNASNDCTKEKILNMQKINTTKCSVEYVYCSEIGKSYALNTGLAMVRTPYFITVDADTYLEKHAVQKIMNHIIACKSACVAGNLYVQNTNDSLITKMQNYDYLLSIAAIKRFQGSYRSTLVAQGAFSAYKTEEVRKLGGWQNVLGEDIVLTYHLLRKGLSSTYEPRAVGYTAVPKTLNALYNQRKRWAIGMIEGLSSVPPWQQGTAYSRNFTLINLSVIYLDIAYLFGLIPAIIIAFLGYFYLAGFLTLFTLFVCVLLFCSMYLYQKKLKIPFKNSALGFILFILLFQTIQSTAALHGYIIQFLHRKGEWK